MDSQNLDRHPQLYFPDGDIALFATKPAPKDGGQQRYLVFRIHKFLLRHHSETFANMIADANAETDTVYDGVPLVEMHGDNAEDLAAMLSYMYNPSYVLTPISLPLLPLNSFRAITFKRHDPNTPLLASGVIRLADKYCLQSLHDHLVAQVVSDWPTTLHEWDVLQGEIAAVWKLALTAAHPPFGGLPSDGAFCDLVPEPVAAIRFAQEFGCPQILPAAFYQLAHIGLAADWRLRDHPGDPPDRAAKRDALARWSMLGEENLLRCLRGFQELDEYFPPIRTFLCARCQPPEGEDGDEDEVARDTGGPGCYAALHRMISTLGTGRRGSKRDPIALLLQCVELRDQAEEIDRRIGKSKDSLCEECWDTFEEQALVERERVWDSLPRFFSLFGENP
ncbi:hypothetical protein GSI_08663 [Ganoderma sinense ZZ0214-1]|uniref:BTB domain-containing protein n=1 Tax=Ganoderma sinense ZZ0214-1 TaxID=1077348 RepID=A0A2G8S4D1_9APHY|nr:hypothetical protein GSI_08663 [Ganoderma sinense ZZ0214-1]